MKITAYLRNAVLTLGTAILLTAVTARADEPRRKRHATAARAGDDQTVTPAKADSSGQIATRDGRHSTSANGSQTGGADRRETRVPTGSNIPQTYHRKGYTTDRSDNTFIYDKNDQRLQGANSVGESLRSVSGVSVGGIR